MSKQTHVPKFGNWDANDNVPFTVVFEKARAYKSTGTANKIINPNDPLDNPTTFGIKTGNPPPYRRPSQQQYPDDFGLRADPGRGRTYANGVPLRPAMTNHSKKGSNSSTSDYEGAGFGEDNRSAEQSPSHPTPAFKGRLGNRPILSSASPDKRGSLDGASLHQYSAPAARTRFRPGSRGEEMPDRTAALPKFGAWDEKDPTSGEAFTVIFSHARNEKKVGGPARIPALQSESVAKMDHADDYEQPQYPIQRKASSWACCFQARNVM